MVSPIRGNQVSIVIIPHGDSFPNTENMSYEEGQLTSLYHLNWLLNAEEVGKILNRIADSITIKEGADMDNILSYERAFSFNRWSYRGIAPWIIGAMKDDSKERKVFSHCKSGSSVVFEF